MAEARFNKEMAKVLIKDGGKTVDAGEILMNNF